MVLSIRWLRQVFGLASAGILLGVLLLDGTFAGTRGDAKGRGEPGVVGTDSKARPIQVAALREKSVADRVKKLEKIVDSLEEDIDDVEDEVKDLGKDFDKTKKYKDRIKDLEDWVEEAQEYPTVRLGGQLAIDAALFDQDDANRDTVDDMQNGYEIRRARLSVKGDLSDYIEYKLGLAFTGDDDGGGAGDFSFLDAFVRFNDLPHLGQLVVGHAVEPFGLERMTSSQATTFMERSLPNVFVPGRSLGIMAARQSCEETRTWAFGYFRTDFDPETGLSAADDGTYALTGRMTWSPIFDQTDDWQRVLHFGGAYSYRNEQNERIRYREQPESRLANNFVSTGRFDVVDQHLFGAEAAWACGPWSVQSEYILARANQPEDPTVDLYGFYVYTSYFLTGEHRPYSRSQGEFKRVKPHEEFARASTDEGLIRGLGAWEIAARWSYLHLNSHNIDGGRLSDVTVGVNWYLTPRTRVMWNYVSANLVDPDDGPSSANIFQMRLQVGF